MKLFLKFEFILRSKINMTTQDIEKIDIETVHQFCKMTESEEIDDHIFRMSCQGIDPTGIPYYKEYMDSLKTESPPEKLSTEEALTYKGFFDRILKKGKK